MRKYLVLAFVGLALVSANASAKDPCKTILCLSGELTGQGGGSECDDAIQDYFGIQVWKKGKFKPSSTKSKRDQFLNQCPAPDGGYKDKISGKWGSSLGM